MFVAEEDAGSWGKVADDVAKRLDWGPEDGATGEFYEDEAGGAALVAAENLFEPVAAVLAVSAGLRSVGTQQYVSDDLLKASSTPGG